MKEVRLDIRGKDTMAQWGIAFHRSEDIVVLIATDEDGDDYVICVAVEKTRCDCQHWFPLITAEKGDMREKMKQAATQHQKVSGHPTRALHYRLVEGE